MEKSQVHRLVATVVLSPAWAGEERALETPCNPTW